MPNTGFRQIINKGGRREIESPEFRTCLLYLKFNAESEQLTTPGEPGR